MAERGKKMGKSIAFVETSGVSSDELKALCREIIPDVKVYQLIDDSLIQEVNANCGPTPFVPQEDDGILQECPGTGSGFDYQPVLQRGGEAADAIMPFLDTPVLKIDQAMAERAVELGRKIAVIATVESTTGPSVRLIESVAAKMGKEIEVDLHLVEGAMMVLIEQGDAEKHNRMVLGEVQKAAKDNDVVVLAQGSMTVLLPLLKDIPVPVLSSPRLCVERWKELLEAQG